MEFLGIGPLELTFILIIMFLVLGPKQMVSAARTLGQVIHKVRDSNLWREINNLRSLPRTLVNEVGLEEEVKELDQTVRKASQDFQAWTGQTIAPQSSPDNNPPKLTAEETFQQAAHEPAPGFGTWSETSDDNSEVAANMDNEQIETSTPSSIPTPVDENQPPERLPENQD